MRYNCWWNLRIVASSISKPKWKSLSFTTALQPSAASPRLPQPQERQVSAERPPAPRGPAHRGRKLKHSWENSEKLAQGSGEGPASPSRAEQPPPGHTWAARALPAWFRAAPAGAAGAGGARPGPRPGAECRPRG